MDAFIAKYDASGTLRWTQQWGTSEWDSIVSLVADGQGNIYIAGVTGGNLWDFSAGWVDAFLVKLRDSEPQVRLQAGDADQDFAFDQLDLVQVQITAKYLSDQLATWGDGDWNGAPGGTPGSPPTGDSLFNHLDIVAALQTELYLTGPYSASRGPNRIAVRSANNWASRTRRSSQSDASRRLNTPGTVDWGL